MAYSMISTGRIEWDLPNRPELTNHVNTLSESGSIAATMAMVRVHASAMSLTSRANAGGVSIGVLDFDDMSSGTSCTKTLSNQLA